jgi:hypothetical protein
MFYRLLRLFLMLIALVAMSTPSYALICGSGLWFIDCQPIMCGCVDIIYSYECIPGVVGNCPTYSDWLATGTLQTMYWRQTFSEYRICVLGCCIPPALG